ncbi:MAG: hypothetical protein AAFZ80_10905 [Cyanobacteria bacterium P01_A01_bin.105]
MQSYSNASSVRLERQRHQLEQLWQAKRSFPGRKPLQQLGNWLLAVLTPTDDLTIRETATGWSVQESHQPQIRYFDSEAALRTWLEQRHLQG